MVVVWWELGPFPLGGWVCGYKDPDTVSLLCVSGCKVCSSDPLAPFWREESVPSPSVLLFCWLQGLSLTDNFNTTLEFHPLPSISAIPASILLFIVSPLPFCLRFFWGNCGIFSTFFHSWYLLTQHITWLYPEVKRARYQRTSLLFSTLFVRV